MTAVRARATALDLLPVLGFALLTALAARITIPLWPVPFTLQTAAVLASGVVLGPRRGAAAQGTLLLAGAAGLPAFAGGLGAAALVGPTAGYLFAFVPAAWLAGAASARWGGTRLILALAGISGLVLAVGAAWLSRFVGPSAWLVGALRFVPSEALKVALVVALPTFRKAA